VIGASADARLSAVQARVPARLRWAAVLGAQSRDPSTLRRANSQQQIHSISAGCFRISRRSRRQLWASSSPPGAPRASSELATPLDGGSGVQHNHALQDRTI